MDHCRVVETSDSAAAMRLVDLADEQVYQYRHDCLSPYDRFICFIIQIQVLRICGNESIPPSRGDDDGDFVEGFVG